MIKNILLVFLSIVGLSCVAQKRNNIQFAGFGYDQWSESNYNLSSSELINSVGRFSYIVGYERLIGNRIAVGGTLNYIFGKSFVTLDRYDNYNPKEIPGYVFDNGIYSIKGYGIGYESKYYFDDFDEDGANSFYLGFNYYYSSIIENFENVSYDKPNGTYLDTIWPEFESNNYGINRLGVKLGYTSSENLSSQLSLGVFYNMPTSAKDKMWASPVVVNSLSFNLTWVVGVPF